jgi:hypothetical protein
MMSSSPLLAPFSARRSVPEAWPAGMVEPILRNGGIPIAPSAIPRAIKAYEIKYLDRNSAALDEIADPHFSKIGSRLAMTYKLLKTAEASWRRLDAHDLIPLVRAGVVFVDGKQPERHNKEVNEERSKKVRRVAA